MSAFPIDFDVINCAALPVLPTLVRRWAPQGILRGDEWVALNPLRDDRRLGSFSTNLRTGRWADFATGDGGGDVISLAAYLSGERQIEATPPESASAETPSKTPIVPAPGDAPPLRFQHPKHGVPTMTTEYHDADGLLVGYIFRWDFEDAEGNLDKTFLPITYCELENCEKGWRSVGLLTPRPLLNLPKMLEYPSATVLVVEGEKTAEVAARMFPNLVVTTSPNGAKSAAKADWSHLKGRHVIICPDNDEEGYEYAYNVDELATAAGAGSAHIVQMPNEFPKNGIWRTLFQRVGPHNAGKI